MMKKSIQSMGSQLAATHVVWQFLVLDGDTVRISKHCQWDGRDKESVTKIVAMVAAVLHAGKDLD